MQDIDYPQATRISESQVNSKKKKCRIGVVGECGAFMFGVLLPARLLGDFESWSEGGVILLATV